MKVKCIKEYDDPFFGNIKSGNILFCEKIKEFGGFRINHFHFSYNVFHEHFINIKTHRKQILDLI